MACLRPTDGWGTPHLVGDGDQTQTTDAKTTPANTNDWVWSWSKSAGLLAGEAGAEQLATGLNQRSTPLL